MGHVYVVHCIDTEGPLFQDSHVLFEQLKSIFGIHIQPTEENLIKLKTGRYDFGEQAQEVQNLLDNKKNETKGSWPEIDDMLERITAPAYRMKLPDSNGTGWKYSWFCMDHVGFTGKNPRRRDSGHHKIFDHYHKLVLEQNQGDVVQFHHHPVSFSGNYNDSGTAFWGKETLNEILTRKIIDRKWFPAAFRPGFHTERPDSHWFLEQWIPFDYGNQAMNSFEQSQPDLADGRYGDWRRAPAEWYPYHPHFEDYQKKGDCRRWIARCLNMYARLRQIEIEDVRQAFSQALERDTILAFTDHDYKDMDYEIERIRHMISVVSQEFPNVSFEYCNAIEAMQKYMNRSPEEIGMKAEIIRAKEGFSILEVTAENEIFGVQPFLAIKTTNGAYHWDNFDFYDKNVWRYTFDHNTLEMADISDIGIASNHSTGTTEVVLWNTKEKKFRTYRS